MRQYIWKPEPFARTFANGKQPSQKKSRKEELEDQARRLNKKGTELREENNPNSGVKDGQIDDSIAGEFTQKQAKAPWHREGADMAPVERMEDPPKEMAKGKLLTTPSRLLKLILPLTALDSSKDHKYVEPLALVVHSQQPLSYLERLIQSELPFIKTKDGKEKVPEVWFRAEDSVQEEDGESAVNRDEIDEEDVEVETDKDGSKMSNVQRQNGKIACDKELGKGEMKDVDIAKSLRGGPGEGGIETYSGLGHDTPRQKNAEPKFVRWSSSTEIGDFIRDAARGREFAVEIEGARKEIRVGVPSFSDRTHYLRVRLRKTAKQLDGMTRLKAECDKAAHKSAQRLAMGGFGVMMIWWAGVYHFSFQTDYGWDTMEPITYLAGLSTLMLGYVYFLWHNREVSYRSALNLTVSRRQNQLYTARGFEIIRWESLVEEANALRNEIKKVANEYDVDWDEKKDEASEIVHQALKKERLKKKNDDEEDEEEHTEKKDD